ncbi:MAG: ATP-dependent Clp protease proteolytic subunit [Verrucomicrobiota bacterium]
MQPLPSVLFCLSIIASSLLAREVDEIKKSSATEEMVQSALEPDLIEPSGPLNTFVVPIDRQIDSATESIVLRALEEAELNDIELIVLDMDTPGGRLDSTLNIMEALDAFEGITITYVRADALSAGAYIAASTDEIYMAPKSIIGAAAVISGAGEDIPETAKQKIDSVLKAKVRTLDRDYRYRADAIRAMMDSEFEFKIGAEIIKETGELLSLTDEEAYEKYGDPPESLLSLGTYDALEELLESRFGEAGTVDSGFKLSWSEELAFTLNSIAPIVLSVGFLLIFVEFKTPGFGLFGTLGIATFIFVFISQFVAGFAGHEPLILFIVGVALVLVEILLIPGTFVSGVLGFSMMAGSLVWVLIGELPSQDFQWNFGLFEDPVSDILLGLLIALAIFTIILRFLPESSLWKKIVLSSSVATASSPQSAKEVGEIIGKVQDRPEVGTRGIAATDMFPSGTVDVGGKRFEARSASGSIEQGAKIVVSGYASYSLIVKTLNAENPS